MQIIESFSIMLLLERPDPPLDIVARNGTNDSFVVTWRSNFHGNSPHLFFMLTVGSPSPSSTQSFTRNVSINIPEDYDIVYTTRVEGETGDVLPYTNYSVAVSGCNKIGCSRNSNISNVILTDEYSKLTISMRTL